MPPEAAAWFDDGVATGFWNRAARRALASSSSADPENRYGEGKLEVEVPSFFFFFFFEAVSLVSVEADDADNAGDDTVYAGWGV